MKTARQEISTGGARVRNIEVAQLLAFSDTISSTVTTAWDLNAPTTGRRMSADPHASVMVGKSKTQDNREEEEDGDEQKEKRNKRDGARRSARSHSYKGRVASERLGRCQRRRGREVGGAERGPERDEKLSHKWRAVRALFAGRCDVDGASRKSVVDTRAARPGAETRGAETTKRADDESERPRRRVCARAILTQLKLISVPWS
ncbi:hypothetical protein BJV74DRAFT_796327 [Russula compacta]|nr:hypothetical protein BJV74DRAFT_796327 [Russula compacta]